MKISRMIIASAILVPAMLPARADQPDYVGLSINGECRIGTCPPTAAQSNHGDTTGFAFFFERIANCTENGCVPVASHAPLSLCRSKPKTRKLSPFGV